MVGENPERLFPHVVFKYGSPAAVYFKAVERWSYLREAHNDFSYDAACKFHHR